MDGEEVTEIGGELMRYLVLFFVQFAPLLFLSPLSYSRIALSADMSS